MSTVAKAYLTIDDFSPGIYSAGTWQVFGENFDGVAVAGAPLGSAQETGTYRCVPLPNGRGLMPAPRHTQTVTVPVSLLTTAGWNQANWQAAATHRMFVEGVTAVRLDSGGASGLGQSFTPIVHVATTASTGATTCVDVFAAIPDANGVNAFTMYSNLLPTGVLIRGTTSFALSSINNTSPYITAGVPVVAIGYQAVVANTLIYPNPATPNVTSTLSVYLATGSRVRWIAHQNRLIALQSATVGFGSAYSTYARFNRINFNQPANSPTFPVQDQVFDPEGTAGYGAFGALNANTLLLIKNSRGGIVVQGDIAQPIVTQVPAVQGTGLFGCDGIVSTIGLAYNSYKAGTWIWTGGAASQKISYQLRDDFWWVDPAITEFIGYSSGSSNTVRSQPGYVSCIRECGDYLIVSNNWLFHTPTKSWWRLEDVDEFVGLYAEVSADQQQIFVSDAGDLTIDSGSINVGRLWDTAVGAHSYSWQSQFIPATIEKMVEVSELVVSCQGTGTIQFTGRGFDGDDTGSTGTVTAPVTVTLPTEAQFQPVKIRVPFSIDGYNLAIKVEAEGLTHGSLPVIEDPAPIIYSISLGYDESNSVAVQ